jgi:hypothetical protein
MTGVADDRDSLVEDQNTYPKKRRKPSRETRLSDKWRSGWAGNPAGLDSFAKELSSDIKKPDAFASG